MKATSGLQYHNHEQFLFFRGSRGVTTTNSKTVVLGRQTSYNSNDNNNTSMHTAVQ